jgi:hypothetical protein
MVSHLVMVSDLVMVSLSNHTTELVEGACCNLSTHRT